METAVDGFVLADDALVQSLFEDEQLVPLGFHHARDRDAGPGADDLGDFLGPDFLAQQSAARRRGRGGGADGFEPLAESCLRSLSS